MPTAYTAGILDGSITNFKDFAKLCVRAFGAAIHMREEPFDAEYHPDSPSDYHFKQIENYKQELEFLKELTNEELIQQKRDKLLEERTRMENSNRMSLENKKRMEVILEEAYNYKPPTVQHEEIRKFMIDQLTKTIEFDCRAFYNGSRFEEIDKALENLDADEILREKQLSILKDLEYHSKEYREEVERINERNKWVKAFFDSLENNA